MAAIAEVAIRLLIHGVSLSTTPLSNQLSDKAGKPVLNGSTARRFNQLLQRRIVPVLKAAGDTTGKTVLAVPRPLGRL